MKKIILVIGIIILVLTFCVNEIKTTNSNLNLTRLISANNASAEGVATVPCYYIHVPGGPFRARWCEDCSWQDIPLISGWSTCDVNY